MRRAFAPLRLFESVFPNLRSRLSLNLLLGVLAEAVDERNGQRATRALAWGKRREQRVACDRT